MLSPQMIEILIHYWCSFADYDPDRLEAPAVAECIDELLSLDILEYALPGNSGNAKYVGNRKALEPYINELIKIPLPIKKWVVENPLESVA